MGRKYNFGQFLRIVRGLKEKIPNCAITTDVIVGFGGETEEEFEESLENIKKCGFAKIHVFPYSERTGTKGATEGFLQEYGEVKKEERKRRARILLDYAKCAREDFVKKQVGSVQEVIYEKGGGYTPNYVRVEVKGEFKSGEVIRVKLVGDDGEKCFGEVV